MKNLITILVLLLTQMVFGQTAIAPAAGDGTIGNPYQIATLQNLYWIQEQSSRWSLYYIQTADIDASATQYWDDSDDNIDGDLYNDPNDATVAGNNEGWPPIGNATTQFSGDYNGQAHTINGLFIARASSDYVGLFGYTSSALIENLGVTNVNIAGSWETGGLVGLLYNNSTISNCYSIGNVSGAGYVGGLVAHNDGGSTVSKSYSRGTVSGSSNYVGGLVGGNRSSTVSNSYSTANASTSGIYVGGLVGYHTSSTVSNSYSTGTVSGSNHVGGLVGYVTIGATESNCFWDTETSGTSNSATGMGKTTAQLKTLSTYTGWDFTNTWWMADGETRPILRTEWSTTIGNSHQLQLMSMDLTAAYVLNNNIDLSDIKVQKEMWGTSGSSGSGFVPTGNGSTHFTGSFDGQGFAIDGLYINRPATSYIGLFGSASAATIQNLGITNIALTGTGNVGGIVGYTQTSGSITNCYTTGTIAANNDNVGGLVGYNWKANISRCYANVTVTVSGNRNYTGGLIGINTENNTISDCYSRGDVSGYNYVGGLVGAHTINTLIDKCYSIGNVTGTLNTGGLVGYNNSTVTASFWNSDIEAIGIGGGTTTGATGKTTVEMKTQSTFLDAGWSSAIWNIGDGINDGYPYLDWQNPSGTPLPVELTSFTAATSSASTGSAAAVVLYWTTATEVNNYGFEIQRSVVSDQRSEWETIGFVEGNGNSNSPKDYSYIDENVAAGNYLYRLKQIDNNGEFSYSKEIEVDVEYIPTEFALHQNYPNPFNPTTKIRYSIPSFESHSGAAEQNVSLKIYDVLGNEVATLVNENKAAGNYEVLWNAASLASGVYIYRINVNNNIKPDAFVQVMKMVLIK